MSRTGGSAGAPVVVGVIGALPPVGYLEPRTTYYVVDSNSNEEADAL